MKAMGSLSESNVNSESGYNFPDEQQPGFRRRMLHQERWRLPRRYIIAIMMCVLFIILEMKELNITYTLAHAMITDDAHELYPTIANWTFDELADLETAQMVGVICVQIPAGLLLFFVSSHKFLSVSIACSSLAHLLTPLALEHHTIALLFVLIAQQILAAPTKIAVLCMWKDWASPMERTRLLVISFFGLFLCTVSSPLFVFLMQYLKECIYIAGVCGLVWSLLWFVMISDTPSNDPLITEKEFLYLQNNIPSTVKETSKLSEVPWKCILSSRSVYVLCLVSFKVYISMTIISITATAFAYHLAVYTNAMFFCIPFVISVAVILPASTILSDFLVRKFRGQILNIRKGFICGAFVAHAILLFGTFADSSIIFITAFCLSYIIFHASIPGFITLSLDLSCRFIPIIGGMIGTFNFLAVFLGTRYMEHAANWHSPSGVFVWIFLFDALLSLITAAAFFQWGSAEEEPWSLNFSTTHRPSSDYKCYPKPDDEEDLNLVNEPL